ncbi:hypothetical protein NoPa_00150 [Pseudomonas phage vB_PpuM-NoPa]|uniref:Uncharacterized protein n=4 Tax=Tartuvirus TaxID=3424912 RepID=A0AAX4MYD4_9CAUD
MITVNAKPATLEFKGHRKGTLLQSKEDYKDGKNIYLVLRDSPIGSEIYAVRLVSGGGFHSHLFEVCTSISHDLVELFHGELVIKNG